MQWLAALIIFAAGIWIFLPLLGPVKGPDNTSSGNPAPNLEDKIDAFAEAIARAEGFYISGSIPATAHNPGDLGPEDSGTQYGVIQASGSAVSILPSDEIGWMLLKNKLRRALTGGSTVYKPSMTFIEFAQKYSGDWWNWTVNITKYLGVQPGTTLQQWLDS